jgi:hypothetical protein
MPEEGKRLNKIWAYSRKRGLTEGGNEENEEAEELERKGWTATRNLLNHGWTQRGKAATKVK